MSDIVIKKIRTQQGDLPIDYQSLANLPLIDTTLTEVGQLADAKAVGDAINDINNRLRDLEYEKISITSLSNNVNITEIGNTVNSVTLSWSINKEPITLTLNDEIINTSATSKIFTDLSITSDKIWTLKAIDEKDVISQKTTSIVFYSGVYYGASSSITYDSAFINSLNKILTNENSRTITVNAGTDQYIYYCSPEKFGECNFSVNGFCGGFEKILTKEFTNSYGHSEKYNIYKSINTNLGRTIIEVR